MVLDPSVLRGHARATLRAGVTAAPRVLPGPSARYRARTRIEKMFRLVETWGFYLIVMLAQDPEQPQLHPKDYLDSSGSRGRGRIRDGASRPWGRAPQCRPAGARLVGLPPGSMHPPPRAFQGTNEYLYSLDSIWLPSKFPDVVLVARSNFSSRTPREWS